MKNIKVFLTVILIGLSVSAFAQKVKMKKGDILVDDVAWLKYDGCGTFESICSILNLQGEEIIFIKTYNLEGEAPISPSNPKGNLYYHEVKFLGMNLSVEFEDRTQKKILELIYKGKLVDEKGQLDEEQVQRFVEKYGMPVSARLNRKTSNTIIIKEDSDDDRPKVNISIGR
ncbi:MAG: hypothetical protein EOO48_02450 [Flavobacterium sp.]|nr:MAG: hypothetical protein EOO48_02450 [Flavobacterium sp.]